MNAFRQESAFSKEELARQFEYMYRLRLINEADEAKMGRKKKFFSLAMGCQMNVHDSEKLDGMLNEMGYEKTDIETDADFIIYNTCCVRENAEQKVYGKLGWLKHYKKINPNLTIALCGCMMQQDTVIQTLRERYRYVDIVFGTFNLYKLPELMATRIESNRTVYDIWQEQKEVVEDLPSIRQYPFKSSVNIMFGCNNFCSYCIVPYVRGRERSRRPEDILAEVRRLVQDGVKEITLLGQNVNSYGKNLEEPIDFAQLLRMINQVEGLERIRFMTSHPKDLSDDLIAAMRDCDKVCKYLHLPFQAGSTEVLRRMNRRYTKEDYLELVRKAREAMPDLALSADIMVGFPGETEEDFQETMEVIRAVKFSATFTFFYSKRTGTPAAIMEDQVPEAVAKDRFDRMLAEINPIIYELNKKQVGTTVTVLVEEVGGPQNGKTILTGRADNHALVHFAGGADLVGQLVPVKIIDNTTFYLTGERV